MYMRDKRDITLFRRKKHLSTIFSNCIIRHELKFVISTMPFRVIYSDANIFEEIKNIRSICADRVSNLLQPLRPCGNCVDVFGCLLISRL